MERFTVPKHLDDPELIGFWTLDEFLIMVIPFVWGLLAGHVVIGLAISVTAWIFYRKIKSGRSIYWILHFAYWHLPGEFFGLKSAPPSHLRTMAG